MFNPVATYRIQFHKDFSFSDFEETLPYLQKLGVTTVYASPVFESVPGSMHGYDGVNPNKIDPEIGTEEQLVKIREKLKQQGMHWLQDIVPNHMAFHPQNAWLMDLLEKGPESEFTGFFDYDSKSPVHQGKLMVPFLGNSLEEVIKNNELQLVQKNEKLFFSYYESLFPLNRKSRDILKALSNRTEEALEKANSSPGLLKKIADRQYYSLCTWQETDRQINYRRFFTINGLICLNIQDKKVFEAFHQQIKKLTQEGIFNGLRIDHIDGLQDPAKYLHQLKALVGEEVYVVVEKILHADEKLPSDWECEGTTGYDFLAQVNNLFTDTGAYRKFTDFYHKLLPDQVPLTKQEKDKKALILNNHMKGEAENLFRLFMELELTDPEAVPEENIKAVIRHFLIECPVYRFYGNTFPLDEKEIESLESIFKKIKAGHPSLTEAAGLFEAAFIYKPAHADISYNRRVSRFYQRLMQFSGPLAAKGVEDTLMYCFNRFIGHNDVGDSPENFGLKTIYAHQRFLDRQRDWPLTMNTTSTHDTKRGEDVRARLNVLTDLAGEWIKTVKKWQVLNADLKKQNAPDANDEYFIYQTLAGAYPIPGMPDDDFPERIKNYLPKAWREAKIHSDWTKPNESYEQATLDFALALLDKQKPFWNDFKNFLEKTADFGIINSLAQVLLKFTCPGTPDVYQGAELWDLSLVDPDNRRPVDYSLREKLLEKLLEKPEENKLSELWKNRSDGSIKLWLTHQLLVERKNNPVLFSKGLYLPLKTEGAYKKNIFAFARRYQNDWILVAAPLGIARICEEQKKGIFEVNWRDTRIILRPEMPADYENILSGEKGNLKNKVLIEDLFRDFPLAVLRIKARPNSRGAGILLAISSLPSPFGAGDLGKEAYRFAKFLNSAKQKYWQILPLNPTESGSAHSPYSSYSSMAGNPLLISPEILADEGLLHPGSLSYYHQQPDDKADYAKAESIKYKLFEAAYKRFSQKTYPKLKHKFEQFCHQEAFWLDDMSLFSVLKKHHGNKTWNLWPEQYKKRDEAALEAFRSMHAEEIRYIKWLQFLFFAQWKKLREYVNSLGIQFFGDMPFYVSYDSVDVWSHPEIFCMDEAGNATGIAGVPPDYFSETGQLWGMPTYNWGALKKQNYQWWASRLKKNLELFDLLRIDHFRALQDYWQVPYGEKTAINGKWLPGPRKDFFEAMEKQIGRLPFVAEDLGDRMEAVYALRSQIGLPGMKVLQFAWGENMPESVDIPHNHEKNTIVYTGTHDNNTTIGWYEEETNKSDHERMHHYLGIKPKQKRIHRILSRVAYASVGNVAVLPMQDILGLGAETRMNTPGKEEGNWLWRLKPGEADISIAEMLRDWVETYNR